MRISELDLKGVFEIKLDLLKDERGHFSRSFCAEEFSNYKIPTQFCQTNISFNHQRGTLRGMHYQAAPHSEGKLIRCTKGKVFDVAADLRPSSPTYQSWVGIELCATKYNQIFIPPGFAHGYISLEDDTEVLYQMTAKYCPDNAQGFRHDDPAFNIKWPIEIECLSKKDGSWPDYLTHSSISLN